MLVDNQSNSLGWKSLVYDIPAALAAAFLQFVFSMSYAAGNSNHTLYIFLVQTSLQI
jgi:hypothetical protein